jgi:hypothetical protein
MYSMGASDLSGSWVNTNYVGVDFESDSTSKLNDLLFYICERRNFVISILSNYTVHTKHEKFNQSNLEFL